MLVLEYKAKVKPSQVLAIEEAIITVQFVRNKALRFWIDAAREAKIDRFALNKYSTELRKEFSFVEDLNSMAVQSAAERAWSAISRFYDNCKSGKPGSKGYPRFQHDNRSVEYKTSGWKLHPTKRCITFSDKKGIGKLRLMGKWYIHSYSTKLIKRVRIVRQANGYYVQFCVDTECSESTPLTGLEIGLDMGLEYFLSDSNGNHEENPHFLRKSEELVKHCQRRIYSKQKGKKNRIKARKRYAKKHLKISRQRSEHAKRLARRVMQSNDLCAYENLQVRNLMKNHNLAKSIGDVGWRIFRLWLEHFATKFGKIAVAVAPHYTSQKCSSCGTIVKKSLSTRTHVCRCGCELQRDVNAAINILDLAKTTVGQTGSNASGVGTATLAGESLLQQVLTLNEESPQAKARGVSIQWQNHVARKLVVCHGGNLP